MFKFELNLNVNGFILKLSITVNNHYKLEILNAVLTDKRALQSGVSLSNVGVFDWVHF